MSVIDTNGPENQAVNALSISQGGHLDFSPTEIEAAEEIFSSICHPFPDIWSAELKCGSVYVIVALFLSRLPGLVELDLGLGSLNHSKFIGTVMKHMLISPLRFSGLFQSLEIAKFGLDVEPYLPWFHADPDSIRPLFYLPRIKIIDIVMPEPVILLAERRSLIVVYQTETRLGVSRPCIYIHSS